MNKWIENNETGKRVGDLPLDFGEVQAKKSMESLIKIINEILSEEDDIPDSYEFKGSFVKSVKDRENQKSVELGNLDELFSVKQGENMNTYEKSYEEIINKLSDVLDIMDDEDFKKSMDKNQKLQDLHTILSVLTTQFEKLQKDTKLKEKNNELIDRCLDIECNFSRKTNTDSLSLLIKDYREVNKLDRYDNSENLSKAISVEAGELLELFNFNIGEKVCQEDIEDALGDILIYCFSLAYELNRPVDRIIARKIKKNIELNPKR